MHEFFFTRKLARPRVGAPACWCALVCWRARGSCLTGAGKGRSARSSFCPIWFRSSTDLQWLTVDTRICHTYDFPLTRHPQGTEGRRSGLRGNVNENLQTPATGTHHTYYFDCPDGYSLTKPYCARKLLQEPRVVDEGRDALFIDHCLRDWGTDVTTIIVVEPNALLRLGILQLFQKLATEISCDGVGYAQLFNGGAATAPTDLMLLSAPDTYEQTAELIQAGQKVYNPSRILLLFEPPHPAFTLRSLSPKLVGYVSKRAPTAMLTAAINLVLAGGTCFPNPDAPQRQDGAPPASGTIPQRRWYEQVEPLPQQPASSTRTDEVAAPIRSPISIHQDPPSADRPPDRPPAPAPATSSLRSPSASTPNGVLPRDLIASESRMLNLTSRQYEVLVLLAHGYPIKTVSRELNISISTAKTHADTLYQRLSVHNSLAAVYEALTRGATLGLSQNPLAQLGAPPQRGSGAAGN